MSDSPVIVRQAVREDVPALVELNSLAYPSMAEEDIIYQQSHMEKHQEVFPEGQLVAVIDGEMVGACATLIVEMGPNPLRHHTWAGITDSGFFTNHNPQGDTLYGADVYVHPEYRGLGVGAALYEARRNLCRKLNLRRILLGGRLWNYHEYAEQYTPHEYAARVAAGEISDLVLSFQLREGFELRDVMPNYVLDPLSHNYASLLEWLNPDYRPPAKRARKVRVACVQYGMRGIESFDDFARQVTYFTDIAADYRCDLVMFPELFTLQLLSCMEAMTPQEGIRSLAGHTDDFLELMRGLATSYGLTIIAGSHPIVEGDATFNISPICLPDGRIARQPKLHITPNERKWWGITGGDVLQVVHTPKVTIGVLICYDIEFPEATRHLADEGADLIFVPYCTDTRPGYLRVRYCAQARAIENQVYVALAGNVGNLPAVENMDINYSQAAVLTPSDFPFSRDAVASESELSEETILMCDLDLDVLHDARGGGTVTPRLDRRADLFEQTAHVPRERPPQAKPGEKPLGKQPIRTADEGAAP